MTLAPLEAATLAVASPIPVADPASDSSPRPQSLLRHLTLVYRV